MMSEKPIIGISGNFKADDGQVMLSRAYVDAVAQSGACPIVLPPISDLEAIERTLDRIDGIIFSGGADFSPEYIGEEPILEDCSFNPERDYAEFNMVRMALERQMPVLGICRGEQLLGLATGGSLWQDLPSQTGITGHSQKAPRPEATHRVKVADGTLLKKILGEDILNVNSFHHQAVKRTSGEFVVSAFAEDGTIEAVESAEFKPVLGVQWHPECMTESEPVNRKLFKWLCDEAVLYRRTREIQKKAISIDFHCDVPMFFDGEYDIYGGGTNSRGNMDFSAMGDEKLERIPSRVDLRRMGISGQDSAVMAAYIRQGKRDEAGLKAATEKAEQLLEELRERVAGYGNEAGIARTFEDIINLKEAGKIAVVQGVENGYAIARDISIVDRFAEQGVVYITLCHNGHNDICDSAAEQDKPEHNGLSGFGRNVVKRMNEAGVIVDVSHASEKTFYDAVECSKVPIVASHSSVWSLCRHPRNLKDEQIKLLACTGGVMGICFYDCFLAEGRKATVKDIVNHIKYVKDLVGVDYVGIGSDFDGGGGVTGCNNSAEMICLTRELLREGFNEDEIIKILGGNFLRVMDIVQKGFLKKS